MLIIAGRRKARGVGGAGGGVWLWRAGGGRSAGADGGGDEGRGEVGRVGEGDGGAGCGRGGRRCGC